MDIVAQNGMHSVVVFSTSRKDGRNAKDYNVREREASDLILRRRTLKVYVTWLLSVPVVIGSTDT